MLHDYMTLWKRQSYRESKRISSCQEFGGGEGCIGGALESFKGRETVLCDTLMVDTSHYELGKPKELYNTKFEP